MFIDFTLMFNYRSFLLNDENPPNVGFDDFVKRNIVIE